MCRKPSVSTEVLLPPVPVWWGQTAAVWRGLMQAMEEAKGLVSVVSVRKRIKLLFMTLLTSKQNKKIHNL